MKKKQKKITFSPIYEPIIHKRFVEDYLQVESSELELAQYFFGKKITNSMNRDINEQARNAQHDVLYYATSDMVSLAVAASNSEVPQVAPTSTENATVNSNGWHHATAKTAG